MLRQYGPSHAARFLRQCLAWAIVGEYFWGLLTAPYLSASRAIMARRRRFGFCFLAFVILSLHCKPTPPSDDNDVVVVGAGLAGLSAAYALNKAGLRVTVLEERPVLGGRVATATYAPGVAGEYGMQEIWEDSPLLGLAKELNLPLDDPPDPAFSSVLLDGNVFAFTQATPQQYLDDFLGHDEAKKTRDWLDAARKLHASARHVGLADPAVRALQEISFAEWVAQAHLSSRATAWLRLTVECELAAEAETFSALSALLDMEMFFGDGMKNYHIQGGNLRVVQALAKPLGARVITGAQVTAIRRTEAGARHPITVRYEQQHQVLQLKARRVVLAIPSIRLHQIYLEPPLPVDYWSGVNSLRFGHYVVVHLLSPTQARSLLPPDAFPILAGGTLGVIYGLQASPAPARMDIFGLLIYGEPARQFHLAPREARVADIRRNLRALWPAYAGTLDEAFVYTYHPTALPVWPVGRSSIDPLAETLRRPHMGLYLAGDYTRGAHATAAVQSGLDVAQAIIAELTPAKRTAPVN